MYRAVSTISPRVFAVKVLKTEGDVHQARKDMLKEATMLQYVSLRVQCACAVADFICVLEVQCGIHMSLI